MSVVICGGAGFVGLNLAQTLLDQGRHVVLADLAPPPQELWRRLPQDGIAYKKMDVTDPDSVKSVITRDTTQIVFGAAITATAERDRVMPELIMTTNLVGFVNVLRAARDARVDRVVNLSSTAAYGGAAFEDDILDEGTTRPDPDSLYSISKFATEKVARRMADIWSMDIRSVRLSGVFGRFEYRTSFRDTPSPLYQVVEAAKNGSPALLNRPGLRDWTYGPDIAGAIAALLNKPSPAHDLYNIATGTPFSVLDWGQELARHIPSFECRLAGPQESANIDLFAGRDRSPLSIIRLHEDLEFKPEFDLQASAADYWRWLNA